MPRVEIQSRATTAAATARQATYATIVSRIGRVDASAGNAPKPAPATPIPISQRLTEFIGPTPRELRRASRPSKRVASLGPTTGWTALRRPAARRLPKKGAGGADARATFAHSL